MAFDARSRKKKMALVLVIFLASFTLSLLQRTKRDQDKLQQTARCKELRAMLQTKNLSDSSHFHMITSDKVQALQIESWKLPTKDKRILENLLLSQECHWEPDAVVMAKYRFNLPPMNYSEDVGTKTHLVTVNPSILQKKFNQLLARRKPFADTLRPYGDALFLIPSLSFMGHSDVGYRAIYTMEDFGLMQRAFFMNPRYLDSLSNYWKKRTLKPRRLSSGFMLVNMALEFCQHVTLYGFWPFPLDLERRAIPHHYYDDTWPKPGVHAMPEEFSNYLDMYARGVLQLRLGKCT